MPSRYEITEARAIAVSSQPHATTTLDAMAARLRAIEDPMWMLCAARAAMQRADGFINDGDLIEARKQLANWRQ